MRVCVCVSGRWDGERGAWLAHGRGFVVADVERQGKIVPRVCAAAIA